jgi:hypothetical protein
MKKNKISFETYFWVYREIEKPFEVVDAFFDYAHLDYYKQTLGEAVLYSRKRKIYKKHCPGEVFVFYTALRSFVKACYCLQSKSSKWKVKESAENWSILHQASLTAEEYVNPFIVFQNAFAEKTLDDFEFLLCEIVQLSLSSRIDDFHFDLITPYIHLIKMLDATELMRERGVEKIKRNEQPCG